MVNFHFEWWYAIRQNATPEQAAEIVDSIFEYVDSGVERKLEDPVSDSLFALIKMQIDMMNSD